MEEIHGKYSRNFGIRKTPREHSKSCGGYFMLRKKPTAKKGLNIIIVGCGKIGSALLERLCKEEDSHDITVIDKDSERVQYFANQFDVMGIVGNGASYNIQLEAGIQHADLFIAVTRSDELNLLCCTVAKQVSDCATIARVCNPDYSKEVGYLQNKLGLAMIINPENEFAREVSKILAAPTALEVNSFAHGRAELIKIKIPEGNMLDGMTIAKMSSMIDVKSIICAVEKDGEVTIPSGAYVLHAGDIISVVLSKNDVKLFMETIGFKTKRVKDTMIIGGGKAAYYLAKRLMHMGINVKIIEKDRARCEELSVLLPKAIIINGDGTDRELLREEGIHKTESFVPITGIDEENIILTLHARQLSDTKIVTKVNRTSFKDVISSLELGSVVYPRYFTTEAIIAYVRAKTNSMDSNIETLYHMYDHRVEAIEFVVQKESSVTNVELRNLKLKKNLLVCCINRNGNIIIPSGDDTIQVNDSVIIVTIHSGFKDIQDILQ